MQRLLSANAAHWDWALSRSVRDDLELDFFPTCFFWRSRCRSARGPRSPTPTSRRQVHGRRGGPPAPLSVAARPVETHVAALLLGITAGRHRPLLLQDWRPRDQRALMSRGVVATSTLTWARRAASLPLLLPSAGINDLSHERAGNAPASVRSLGIDCIPATPCLLRRRATRARAGRRAAADRRNSSRRRPAPPPLRRRLPRVADGCFALCSSFARPCHASPPTRRSARSATRCSSRAPAPPRRGVVGAHGNAWTDEQAPLHGGDQSGGRWDIDRGDDYTVRRRSAVALPALVAGCASRWRSFSPSRARSCESTRGRSCAVPWKVMAKARGLPNAREALVTMGSVAGGGAAHGPRGDGAGGGCVPRF